MNVENTRHVGYQYVTLRFVPRVDREEFLNVGVVVYAQMADYLEAGFLVDEAAIAAFAPGFAHAELEASLASLCAAVRGEPCPGRPDMPKLGQRFGWISAPRSTVVQPGPLHGGVTADPHETLRHLVRTLVERQPLPGR